MPSFRIHLQGSEPITIVAETSAEARKIAEGKNLGRVQKSKLVREQA